MTSEITSKENANIKYAKKLLSSAKFRKEENAFLIEGVKLCGDAFQNRVSIQKVFYTKKCFEKFENVVSSIIKSSESSFMVSQSIIETISDTNTPQGIVCICKCESKKSDETECEKIILLENIQNPSNLGSILRTCDALGISMVAVSQNSCDVYNPKTLRGSMGAVFRLNIILFEDSVKFIKNLQKNNFKIYATVLDDNVSLTGNIKFVGKIGIVFGNEGSGLAEEIIEACDEKMTIPMSNSAESLNVSVAAGIVIWEITNRGKNING